MILKRIKILNFKNYEETELHFSDKINCFTGLNGSGKTNLLDAVHFLSFTKSFSQSSDLLSVNHDSDFFMIQGDYQLHDRTEHVYCGFKKGQKKVVKRNDKAYSRYSEHIGLLPAVVVSPDDSVLITGASEERRKYLDSVISQFDKPYLDELIRYNRILAQRNALLKDFAKQNYFNADTLDVFDFQLAKSGKLLFEKRSKFVEDLVPVFQKYYDYISGGNEQVGLSYKSQLSENELENLLKLTTEKDRALQHTSAGIHRDDLVYKLNDFPIRQIASQGQQKTYLIALKFAQFEYLRIQNNLKPLLLLDDIFDKFDEQRVSQIIALTSDETFGQIFITDTNHDRLDRILKSRNIEHKTFKVSKGTVNETTT